MMKKLFHFFAAVFVLCLSPAFFSCNEAASGELQVTTFAGSGEEGYANGIGTEAEFNWPEGLAFDRAGNLYVTDYDNHRVRKISPKGEVTAFAGSGEEGYANGTGTEAQFAGPAGLAFDRAGNLYVADFGDHRIRKISPKGEVTTFAGSGERGYANGTGTEAQFDSPESLAFDGPGTSMSRIGEITGYEK
jgi:DNA-binding beta-propeller fold protein YncE